MSDIDALRGLLSAKAVRERAHEILSFVAGGRSSHWLFDETRLETATDLTLEATLADYPDLDIPLHARWRHFVIGGIDRGAPYREGKEPARERARAAFDLAVTSVLLDAGAGEGWAYRTADGALLRRSEGLAAASIDLFESGLLSASLEEPRRVDARALAQLSVDRLGAALQADAANPLPGIEGRFFLLRRLGEAMERRPDVFGVDGSLRPAGLFDFFAARAIDGGLDADDVLVILLDALGAIWPSRLTIEGVLLGDSWRHPAIVRADRSDGVVPLHKLTQWMAYSLIEPLAWGGVEVRRVDALTGLAEYRNGGLFVDAGVLRLREPSQATRPHAAGDPLIVEWRAATIALLDKVAERLRARLRMDGAALPLARVLQGGTWSAGRRIAASRRPGGTPPLAIVSDGTLF